jgi:hypothetical protein
MPTKPLAGARKVPVRRTSDPTQRALVEGYRSGLEEKIAADLERAGHTVEFETFKIPFVQPVKPRTYTPDFPLRNGVVVETKGRFLTEARQKHKLIKEQHPDLDIRFVFSNSKTKLSKGSPTTYAMWCAKNGFQWADKAIPQSWLDEAPCAQRIAALRAIAIPSKKSTS